MSQFRMRDWPIVLGLLYSAIMNFELTIHHDNIAKHGVSAEEVEDCFLDRARFIKRIGQNIYWLIGCTQAGRLLQIGYRKEADKIAFVFHAMKARPHEQTLYKRRGK